MFPFIDYTTTLVPTLTKSASPTASVVVPFTALMFKKGGLQLGVGLSNDGCSDIMQIETCGSSIMENDARLVWKWDPSYVGRERDPRWKTLQSGSSEAAVGPRALKGFRV